jgi:hypothetical protein
MAKHTRKHRKMSHKARKSTHKKRRITKGASAWNKKVMEVYREMKRKNPNVKLGDAMKEAARRK